MDELSELFADCAEDVQAGIRDLGWNEPMPVQAQTIPLMREGADLIVQARTGSGKTGAFGIPIIEAVDCDLAETQALVMLPTRELANQVAIEVKALGHAQGLLLTGPVRDYAMKKYTGHRRVPANILQDLRRDMLALHAGAQAETGAAAALRAQQSRRGPGKAGEEHGRVGGCV